MRQHIGCDLTDDEVVHPVGRGTESDTIWTVGHGPDLSDDDPRARSPGVTEEDDEEPDHDASSPTGALVAWPVVLEAGDDTGDDEMAGGHADGTADEDGLTTQLVDVHDGGDGGEEHDDSDDTCGEQVDRVARQAETREDGRRIVQDGVDTSPLLEEHGKCGNSDALEHAPGGEQTTDSNKLELEDGHSAHVLEMREVLCKRLLLEQTLGADLGVLELDEFVVGRQVSEAGENTTGFVLAVVVDEPTG